MKFNKTIILTVTLGALFSLQCAWVPVVDTKTPLRKLHQDLDVLFSDPLLSDALWGAAVQSLQTNEYLYLKNERKLFVPGSNVKLFTTAAALLALGPHFQYKTILYCSGYITETGILTGDIVLQGAGDPTLYSSYYKDSPTRLFEDFTDSLCARGVKGFHGRIIGDDGIFADEKWGVGWAWDYLDRSYAAPIGALSCRDNCIDITFIPADSVGKPALFTVDPAMDSIHIMNDVITIDSMGVTEIHSRWPRENEKIYIHGQIKINDIDNMTRISVQDPTYFALYYLSTVMKQSLPDFQAEFIDIHELPEYEYCADSSIVLVSRQSPPLSDIIRVINQKSQNLHAELLLRTMGYECAAGGSAREGLNVIHKKMTGLGLDSTLCIFVDGSGLSRKNFITPLTIVGLLRTVRSVASGEIFYQSLPVAGESGTLSSRMIAIAAGRKVRAKTGTLDQVKALSGYITTRDGEDLAFAILINNFTASAEKVIAVQDSVCVRLANFSRIND